MTVSSAVRKSESIPSRRNAENSLNADDDQHVVEHGQDGGHAVAEGVGYAAKGVGDVAQDPDHRQGDGPTARWPLLARSTVRRVRRRTVPVASRSRATSSVARWSSVIGLLRTTRDVSGGLNHGIDAGLAVNVEHLGRAGLALPRTGFQTDCRR